MRKYKAESERLLNLMINSIYTNKEIFLRELISNASDATDKMYYESLRNPEIEFNRDDFYIELEVNKDDRILKVIDHGIGMTKDELDKNLGVIAKSGSFEFKNAEKLEDGVDIIGQFGVGFYSAFMVSEKIEVLSKAYGEDQGYLWSSSGTEGYEIVEADKKETGTEITLHIRKEEEYDKYLEEYTIRNLVEKYSNYIKYPIKMEVTKNRKIEKEEGEEPEYEEYKEFETLNSRIPIWKKNRNELEDSDYINFYHDEKFGYDDPIIWSHIVADGTLSYRAILYIPSKPPFDYYTKDYKKGLELYSNGVMIMEHCEELLPDQYSFVKGVVDSSDLSLNISRETIQQDRQLKVIANKIENKITSELKKLLENDREKYSEFFDAFGNQLKAGIYSSYGMLKDPLGDLLIFDTSKDKNRTFKEYIDGMGEEQKYIYYASGDNIEKIENNPALQMFFDKDIEILYLTDKLDEFVIQMMMNYDDKEFKSAFSEDIDLGNKDKKEKTDEEVEMEKSIFEKMKDILIDEVVDVRESNRLKDGAVSLISTGPISIDMEKTFMDQPGDENIKAMKILEINVDHPVFKKIIEIYEGDDEGKFKKYTNILYDQARLIEGLPIEDPVEFSKNILELM